MSNSATKVQGCYINGEWTVLDPSRVIEVRNPANGEVIAVVPRGNQDDVNRAVNAAKEAFRSKEWRALEQIGRASCRERV